MVLRVPYGNRGQTVAVSPKINCPTHFLPPGDNWPMLEEALSNVTTEEVVEGFCITIDDLSYVTPRTVVENTDRERVFWAVYRGHKLEPPHHSPFINTQEKWPETNSLSLYFSNGYLTQVIPGEDDVPPLPWMRTAVAADGGLKACINYWRDHSLLYSTHNTLPATRSFTAPDWWL